MKEKGCQKILIRMCLIISPELSLFFLYHSLFLQWSGAGEGEDDNYVAVRSVCRVFM